MSDPMTNVEIEDVLSSIRRLVSEDLGPGRDRGGQAAPAAPGAITPAPGKLLLTPAQRVVPLRPAEAKGSLEDTLAQLEAAVSGIGEVFEPEEGDRMPAAAAGDAGPPAGTAAWGGTVWNDPVDDGLGRFLLTDRLDAAREETAAPAADDGAAAAAGDAGGDGSAAPEGQEVTEVAAEAAVFVHHHEAPDTAQLDRMAETWADWATGDEAGGAEPGGTGAAGPEGGAGGGPEDAPEETPAWAQPVNEDRAPAAEAGAAGRPPQAPEHRIRFTAAGAGEADDGMPEDGGAAEAEAEAEAEAMGTFAARPRGPRVIRADLHGDAAGDAGAMPDFHGDLPAGRFGGHAGARHGLTAAGPLAGRGAGRADLPADYEDEPAEDMMVIDADALREIVIAILKQELQGPLGEKITRNVRKLVRAEIHRTLETRDLQ